MRTVGRYHAWVVTAWLISQAAVLAGAPVALCAGMPAGTAVQECTCDHGDGQTCPMHHPAAKSKSSCSCRGTTDSATALLAGLFGPAAVFAAPLATFEPAANSPLPAPFDSRPLDFCLVPDAPPPRA